MPSPFDTWYSTNVAPILEEQIKLLPEPTREPIRKGSREQMAACWNAALRAVCQTKFTREEFPPPCGLPAEIREQILELGPQVTP